MNRSSPPRFWSVVALMASILAADPPQSIASTLHDDFNGSALDGKVWFIPERNPAGDGTFIGRTRFRAAQDSALPSVSDGRVCLPIETYNPAQLSFLATEIISRQEFALGKGLDITVRARMKNADSRGIVGGIFLYWLRPGSDTLHDEIDFELLTNLPDRVQTNIYGDEPLGVGHAQLIPYRSGTVADDHVYEIQWRPGRVSWLVDGAEIRTTTSSVPTHPMQLYLNIWAPDPAWTQGFNASIQPTESKEANAILNALCVDSVVIRPLAP